MLKMLKQLKSIQFITLPVVFSTFQIRCDTAGDAGDEQAVRNGSGRLP